MCAYLVYLIRLSQDREASDSMEAAIRAMRLNPLVRRGVALVRGLELKVVRSPVWLDLM